MSMRAGDRPGTGTDDRSRQVARGVRYRPANSSPYLPAILPRDSIPQGQGETNRQRHQTQHRQRGYRLQVPALEALNRQFARSVAADSSPLAHASKSVAGKHYLVDRPDALTEALAWMGNELGLGAPTRLRALRIQGLRAGQPGG